MKSIYVVFEEEEFKMLKKVKKKLSWHDFIMLATKRAPKPTTDGGIEPKPEEDNDFLNFNEAMEIIKELDPKYDTNGRSGAEIRKHAIEIRGVQ